MLLLVGDREPVLEQADARSAPACARTPAPSGRTPRITSGVQNPITCSTPARLYQLRSKQNDFAGRGQVRAHSAGSTTACARDRWARAALRLGRRAGCKALGRRVARRWAPRWRHLLLIGSLGCVVLAAAVILGRAPRSRGHPRVPGTALVRAGARLSPRRSSSTSVRRWRPTISSRNCAACITGAAIRTRARAFIGASAPFDLHARRVRFIDELREPERLSIRTSDNAITGMRRRRRRPAGVSSRSAGDRQRLSRSTARIGWSWRRPTCRRCCATASS